MNKTIVIAEAGAMNYLQPEITFESKMGKLKQIGQIKACPLPGSIWSFFSTESSNSEAILPALI